MTGTVDLVAYLTGELSADEHAGVEAALRADPALRAEAERLRPLVARLASLPADAWDPVEPPPLAVGPLSPAGRAARAPARRARWRERIVLRPLAAAAASVALLAAGAGGGLLLAGGDGGGQTSTPTAGARVELARIGNAPGASVGVVRMVAADRMEIDVSGLRATGVHRFYEVWLLNSGGDLVSIGSFHVGRSGHAVVTVPLPLPAGSYRFVDISLEPVDGNPAHSSDSVLRGPTAPLAAGGRA